MQKTSNARLFVLSASSGTGKTTLARGLLEADLNLVQLISCTTREPRVGEKDGADYYFITQEEFEARIRKKAFLEHARVFGHYYGTPKREV
ncbi:MAG: guanylate kinase, partial [Candidatus Omnitrophota bacterium]